MPPRKSGVDERKPSKVSALVKTSVDERERIELYGTDQEPKHYGSVEVFNASALPIYGAKVAIASPSGGVWVIPVGFVPGGQHGHAHIPPQPDGRLNGRPVEVNFRDAAGVWWHRGEDGHMCELEEDPYKEPPPGPPD